MAKGYVRQHYNLATRGKLGQDAGGSGKGAATPKSEGTKTPKSSGSSGKKS